MISALFHPVFFAITRCVANCTGDASKSAQAGEFACLRAGKNEKEENGNKVKVALTLIKREFVNLTSQSQFHQKLSLHF